VNDTQSTKTQTSGLTEWISPRRPRFWIALGILTYTLAGFFGVPYLVGNYLADSVSVGLGRKAAASEIRFNPYTFRFALRGFEFSDRDDTQLFAFDEFVVDFQLSSLFRWAWTFREVRLDGAFLFLERFAPGDSRLGRLLADIEALSTDDQSDGARGGLPRLLVHDLEFNRGSVTFVDKVPEAEVELAAGPVSVSVQQLSTLPDRFGQQSVEIRLPGDTLLGWQGNIALAPLHSEGELVIDNSHLDQTIAYLKAILPLDAVQATLSARTGYRLSEQPDGGLDLDLEGLEMELTDVSVTGLQPSTEFFSLSGLEVRGGTLAYPEKELRLKDVRLTDTRLSAWLDDAGRPALLDLAPSEPAGDKPPAESDDREPGWKLAVDRFEIDNGRLDWRDNSFSPSAALSAEAIKLGLSGIDNGAGTVVPASLEGSLVGGGRFSYSGTVVLMPELRLEGAATLTDIPVPSAQPYVERALRVQIDGGRLSAQTELVLQPGERMTVSGRVALNGLDVRDSMENESLLSWESMNIDRFEADAMARELRLSRVDFERPYGRIKINEDRTTNLGGLLVGRGEAEPNGQSDRQAPFGFVIGGIAVAEGAMDFSDLSLPLSFATRITDLGGTVSTIDTASSEPATIRLEGQVDDYGLARIEGGISVLDPVASTDVTVEFRNLAMSQLSPYTVQFAGRKIDEGKLDLELRYRIEQGQLQGQNDILLSDLVLGEEVDHPDAASLPLGLAVALLQDANGVIDIDLPVEGNVNDPEFRVGGVIWQAFVGLITKVVSAPFRMLGSLIGVDSEELGRFQFLAGRYDLTPPELEKIAQLQGALQQRPQITVELAGVYDPAIDEPALRYFRLRDTALERMGEAPGERGETDFQMLDEEIRSTLEILFTERFPSTPLDSIKAEYTNAPSGDPKEEPVLDSLAYATGLWERLLAAERLGPGDLETLADQRADAVRDAFLAAGDFAPDRITRAAPTVVESADGEWVVMELGVAAE
jgi:hypothetical protein